MYTLPKLKAGDNVAIIAPASRCTDIQLAELHNLLASWQLNCIVDAAIFGADLLCANTDAIRSRLLKNVLQATDITAIICARGGYGSMRLIPELTTLIPPTSSKLIVGMSDITALNLYLQQQWHWPTLHATVTPTKISAASIAAVKAMLFGEISQLELHGLPLNTLATQQHTIATTITGGNLCLVQTSIGTVWQINGNNKIILLEEINERGYQVDRMLEHLRQAGIFDNAAAILFGDFLAGTEPDGSSLIQPVLERFAAKCKIPVVQIAGIGHGHTNFPIPLGTRTHLNLGNSIKLTCFR